MPTIENSTAAPSRTKPKKPRKDYPLTPHRNGQFCKKVRGRIHYFGTCPTAALDEWLRIKDDLLAGREPRSDSGEATVADICNQCLAYYADRRDNPDDKFTARSWTAYKAAAESFIEAFGRNRLVKVIMPVDFQVLRTQLAKRKVIQICFTEFSWFTRSTISSVIFDSS